MRTRTKIICTIGPACNSYEMILKLIDAGMNVARINFSHGTHDEHKKVIDSLKKAREKKNVPLAIMLDTKGPEIRTGMMQGGQITLKEGQTLTLRADEIEGTESEIQIVPGSVLKNLEVGSTVLFNDGYISSKVIEVGDRVVVKVANGGVMKDRRGVNIPDADIDLPAMTEKDIADITFGCTQDIDIVAASFIRSADHILEIKRLLVKEGKSNVLVIAKIENSLGVQNFDSIIQVADGVMIARGDLGVELPLKQVPLLQKMMIRKCYLNAKPVITATQMLESMISNPRPTRAEVSDVANAILDSSSAVMLSGETAVGKYPVETVQMMRSIAQEAEKEFDYSIFFSKGSKETFNDVSLSIALATVKTCYGINGRAIFTYTSSGQIARLLSRFRPKMPIVAISCEPHIYHQMALFWGVIPVAPATCSSVREAFDIMSSFATEQKIVKYGDLVTITSGDPFGVKGTTNMMIVESIGDVLVRGKPSEGKTVHGKVLIILSAEEKKKVDTHNRIVVIPRCDTSYEPLLRHALGIVLHNQPDDHASEEYAMHYAKTHDIPLLIRADSALNFLQTGQQVTLDPSRGLVLS